VKKRIREPFDKSGTTPNWHDMGVAQCVWEVSAEGFRRAVESIGKRKCPQGEEVWDWFFEGKQKDSIQEVLKVRK